MTVYPRVTDRPTYEDLVEFWQRVDEPLTRAELHELWHPRTARIVVAARCVFAVILLTTLWCLPIALRAVGRALE